MLLRNATQPLFPETPPFTLQRSDGGVGGMQDISLEMVFPRTFLKFLCAP